MKDKEKIITRFAPSPTGFLHLGSARTALFNYLFTKENGGEMILRIEDTDKERSKPEFEKDILDGLKWLGIKWDKEYRQSERGDIYKKFLQKLLDNGNAYISKEETGKSKEVIRFKNPEKEIIFDDIIRGEIKFDTSELGDFVIAKDLETPLYHLAVVIDDFESKITHIIRGEDHISNTARQILIQEAIGATRPKYAHIPLILAPDKSKLSKRHGAVSVNEYRKDYLPEAINNFIALMGWNPGDDREIFSMDELIKEFKTSKIGKSGSVFNIEKLDWINKEHLKKLSPEEQKKGVEEFLSDKFKGKLLDKILPIITERIEKFSDVKKMEEDGEFDFFIETPEYDIEKLVWKKDTREISQRNLKEVINLLSSLNEEDFQIEQIKKTVWDFADKEGRGSVLWPMRYALSGKEKSPDPFTIASILGKEKTLKRLETAKEKLSDVNK